MEFIIFVIGVTIGAIIMWGISNFHRTCHGWFSVEPYSKDDPGFYDIRVSVPTDDRRMPDATRIILHRFNAQK